MEEYQHEEFWDSVAEEMSKLLNREVSIYSYDDSDDTGSDENSRDITFHVVDKDSGNDYLLMMRQEWGNSRDLDTNNLDNPKTFLSYERMNGAANNDRDDLHKPLEFFMYSEKDVAENIVSAISKWIPPAPNRIKRFKDLYE
jgi:hypothetical protein